MSPSNAIPARRSGLEVPETGTPLAEQEFALFLDDAADLVEFMLSEAFISAQDDRLQPELTGPAALFNMDVRRLKFISEVEMKTVAVLAQDRWHAAVLSVR